jgi:LysM repeat protein
LIAPLALVAAAVVLVVVVGTSLDLDGGGSGSGGDVQGVEIQQETTTTGFGKRYVVKPGDSLSEIAEMSGVPIDEILQLNPDLDPQALISGESVKLR